MFRCWIEILIYGLALSAGAEAHPLLLNATNGTQDGVSTPRVPDDASSSIVRRTTEFPIELKITFISGLAPKKLFRPVKTTMSLKRNPQDFEIYDITLPSSWPCWACKSKSAPSGKFPALAKNHFGKTSASIDHEREGLRKDEQLLDYGTDDSKVRSQWTIVRDMRVISSHWARGQSYRHPIMDIIKLLPPPQNPMSGEFCEMVLGKAYTAAHRRIEEYVSQKGAIIVGANLGNVLFPLSSNWRSDDVVFTNWTSWREGNRLDPKVDEFRKNFYEAGVEHCDREYHRLSPPAAVLASTGSSTHSHSGTNQPRNTRQIF